MRYYIIAGERSGDLHGGNLVKAIRRHDPNAVFRGLGGDYLKNEGVELFTDYRDFAVMGLFDVLANLVKISGYLKKCGRDILNFRADVIILIDYAGFNRQMARFGKKKNIRVFYYISPKIWAWNQSRAYALKATVDRMFVILPFEKDFYRKFGWEVDYVGNPVLDAVKSHRPDADFLSKNGFNSSQPLVALLPGSRRQEVQRILPVMKQVAAKFAHLQFGVATVNNLDNEVYNCLRALPNVRLILEDTYNLLQHAHAAVVTSGTATLETALFRVPEIVVYRTDSISYALAKKVVKVSFISLVNLIAGTEVVRELIQEEATPEKISAELDAILGDEGYRKRMLDHYDAIINLLDTGSASENAARLMVEDLSARMQG